MQSDHRSNGTPVAPLFKWTGGKRWLAPYAASRLPSFHRYQEPFAGGAALFFEIQPRRATLADINPELINAYVAIRDRPAQVADQLRRLRINQNTYDRVRRADPSASCERAARFIYLNRTAFNGIYRVNREGVFNVPFGCKPSTTLPDLHLLQRVADRLKGASLYVRDFAVSIGHARPGDLVYVDPPYVTHHNNNGFRRYNERIFSWEDQVRLAESCKRAADRGVHVLVSCADHVEVIDLYSGFWYETVQRQSAISASVGGRRSVSECLLSSWK